MHESSSLDQERLLCFEHFVEAKYDQLVQKVVKAIQKLPENCRQSGDDSGLADCWEEFKYQVQHEQ